jgi:hypothetical protein
MKIAIVSAFLAPTAAAFSPRAFSLRKATFLRSGDEFTVGVLGDLHIDPRKMEDYVTGHEQWMPILNEAKEKHGNVALVSLGDLGESKNCDHNPDNPSELFAGTTICHELAAEYLSSFEVPYEVVGGNHGKLTELLESRCFFASYSSVQLCQTEARFVYTLAASVQQVPSLLQGVLENLISLKVLMLLDVVSSVGAMHIKR